MSITNLLRRPAVSYGITAAGALIPAAALLLALMKTETEVSRLPLFLAVAFSSLFMFLFLTIGYGRTPIAALLFSFGYAFSPALLSEAGKGLTSALPVIVLPLLLLGIELLLKGSTVPLLPVAMLLSVISGNMPVLMALTVSTLWFLYRLTVVMPKGKTAVYIISVYLISLFAACLAAKDACLPLLSSLYAESDADYIQVSAASLLAKLLPGTYDSLLTYGTPFLYAGILSLLFIPVFFASRISTREKIGGGALIAFSVLLASVLFKLSPNNDGGVRTAVAFLILPAFLPLAAYAFDADRENPSPVLAFNAVFLTLLSSVLERLSPLTPEGFKPKTELYHDSGTMTVTVGALGLYMLFLLAYRENKLFGKAALLITALIEGGYAARLFLTRAETELAGFSPVSVTVDTDVLPLALLSALVAATMISLPPLLRKWVQKI